MHPIDMISNYLMQHGWLGGQPQSQPQVQAPQPVQPINQLAGPRTSQAGVDAMAQKMGFRDAATAAAYYQKQQQMTSGPAADTSASSGGSLWDRMFAVHPAMILNRVSDAFTKAGQ